VSAWGDAQDLADALGVSRGFVYAHADELGAIPLGTGPKPRLRFDVEAIVERLTSEAGTGSHAPETASVRGSRSRRRRRLGTIDPSVPVIRLTARGLRP
jgi:hypothetical protein